jgi:hypothetical protein
VIVSRFEKTSYVISDGGLAPSASQGLIFRNGFCNLAKARRVSTAFVENGFRTRLERLLLDDINRQQAESWKETQGDAGDEKKAITFGSLYGLFVFWAVGLSLGCVSFAREVMVGRCRAARKERQRGIELSGATAEDL